MLRWGLTIVLLVVPTAVCWYLQVRLANYQKEPNRSLGPFEALRPDKYIVDGYSLLYRYYAAIIAALACYAFVVGVLHP